MYPLHRYSNMALFHTSWIYRLTAPNLICAVLSKGWWKSHQNNKSDNINESIMKWYQQNTRCTHRVLNQWFVKGRGRCSETVCLKLDREADLKTAWWRWHMTITCRFARAAGGLKREHNAARDTRWRMRWSCSLKEMTRWLSMDMMMTQNAGNDDN